MTPSLTEFNPALIKHQIDLIKFMRKEYDYKKGILEIMMSGSVGSAKSLVMAHIAVTHCLMNKGALILICRKSMPALKATILQMIIDHLGDDVEYHHNLSTGIVTFDNGSKMIPISWSDKKYKKVRSYAASAAIIEELTENETDEAYKEIVMRVGRIPHIKESFILCATNPDSPSHWAYRHFIENQNESRKVFYSRTENNPFLPASYIKSLKEVLSPKEAKRMLEGEWIELTTDIIYYNYDKERNFIDAYFEPDPRFPIDIMFDFNIGQGKPMSAAAGQRIANRFHIFKDFVVEGARTKDIIEEMSSFGLFELKNKIRVFGDATGKARDTRSIQSDYEIIEKFLNNYIKKDNSFINYEMCVPAANPPIRRRHNLVNASCFNENNRINLLVYKDAMVVDEGLRLTRLKENGNYIEDDSKYYQHVTTALGYYVDYCINILDHRPMPVGLYN